MFHFFTSRFVKSAQTSQGELTLPPVVGGDKPLTLGRGGMVTLATLMSACPKYMALRARISGQPLGEPPTQGRSFLEGVAHTPVKLYQGGGEHLKSMKLHPSQLYEKAQLRFTGHIKGFKEEVALHWSNHEPLLPGDLLMDHVFPNQSEESVDLHFEQQSRHQWKISPFGLINQYPLWPYGGSLNPDTLAMEQLFFTLSYTGPHTQVHLFKGSELEAQGIKGIKSGVIQGRHVRLLDSQQMPHEPWEELLAPLALFLGQETNILYEASHLEPIGDYGCWVYFKRKTESIHTQGDE